MPWACVNWNGLATSKSTISHQFLAGKFVGLQGCGQLTFVGFASGALLVGDLGPAK